MWIAVALVVAWVWIGQLLRGTLEHGFDERLAATLTALLAAVEVTADGAVTLDRPLADPAFERAFSGWYWQVADGAVVRLRSRSLWTEQIAPAGNAGAVGPDGRPLRLLRRTATVPGSPSPLTLTVAGPQDAIDLEAARIGRTLAIALSVLGLGLAVAVLLQTTIGLAPFRRIGRQLADIRGGRRQALDPDTFAEVAPLVREVNALLRHDQEVVARARTHASNLAHALKTPLSVAALEAARRGSPELAEAVGQMDRMIRHHLRRARAAAAHGVLGARVAVGPVLADLLAVLERIHADRHVTVSRDLADDVAFAGERQDLEEMLGNLLDNAFKWSRGRIAVAAVVADGRLRLTIADDGPGRAQADKARALHPRTRLDSGLAGAGVEPAGGPPEQFLRAIARDVEKWKKVVKAANIKISS
ncbi:ATP-binding protein [Stella sp.]|uniref:ATP-binding protein n=1 Tax=Stella sp. TaxID=2912054 RepID=UPI0035AEE631